MKVKNLIKFLIIAILVFSIQSIFFIHKSNAAIEIKEGTSRHTNISANNSFQYCYDMRYPTSSLGNNSLDPHMANGKDWGITAYLGLSSYGTVKDSSAPSITIGESTYTSTTGNKSGVMNFGNAYVQTACYYKDSPSNGYTSKFYEEANKKYVDAITQVTDLEVTKGMALAETSGWYGTGNNSLYNDRHIVLRYNIFGNTAERFSPGYYASGMNWDAATYRPVIWN